MNDLERSRLKNNLRQKSNQELFSIWSENKRHEWPDGTFEIIKEILKNRGIKIPKQKREKNSFVNTDFRKAEKLKIYFFPTSPIKLAVMSICTCGIYEIFWFYKNWKFLKEKYNFKVNPFLRGLFAIFFCHSFFKIVKEYSKQHQITVDYKPVQLTIAYILLTIACSAPDPFWVISDLAFVPLLYTQKAINNLNNKLIPKTTINNKFSGWNIFGIILGIILWLLIIISIFLPKNI
ncbi:MAG: hypothetical protein K9M14_03330 [Candidatus Omnitrophica bacterium]|nr:hypothetical protein [Candidatus Omnitrophota bacterium]MCF7877341.1 hypothetical protein [Candidatus Omnitrophota bacterium]